MADYLKMEDRKLRPMMKALKAVHNAVELQSMTPEELESLRKRLDALGRLITPMIGMDWEPTHIGSIPAAWTVPDRGHDRRRVILYCHGGGYITGNLGYTRILSSRLAHATGFEVLSFEYRLAPEHPCPAALEDALAVWDHLMYQGYGARDVILAGDSAGGNLALCLALKLKEQGRQLPKALVLMSPWTDLTAEGKSYAQRADIDPIISYDYVLSARQAYAGARDDFRSPDLSPLFAELSGLPPTLIQVGTNEVLLSDSVRLRDRMIRHGVPCRLEVWKDVWHVFQMFPIRQAAKAMEHISDFLNKL